MNPTLILLSIVVIVAIIVAVILMSRKLLTYNAIRFPRTCQTDADCDIYKVDLWSRLANNFCGDCSSYTKERFTNQLCPEGFQECKDRASKIYDKKCVGTPAKACRQGFLGSEYMAYQQDIDGYSGDYECDYKDVRCG